MESYNVLILLATLTNWLLLIIVSSNKHLKKLRKDVFSLTFLLIMLCGLCEWAGITLDGLTFKGAFELHYLSKIIELSVTPLIPIICAKTVFETNALLKVTEEKAKRYTNIFVFAVYIVIIVILTAYQVIFYIDGNNIYHHAKCYPLYTVAFLSSGIYFFVKTFKFSKFHQNKNGFILAGILVFITIGVSIQLFTPTVKSCWLTISIAGAFIYIYYNDLTQYIDRLTQLLNQNSYLNRFETINGNFYLVTFDIDDFAKVNNTYGHEKGNLVLEIIASVIRDVYSKSGTCYRSGGDEFAVILSPKANVDKLNSEFCEKLGEKRKEQEERNKIIRQKEQEQEQQSSQEQSDKNHSDIFEIPYVSYGYTLYNKTEEKSINMKKLRGVADEQLYSFKESSKKARSAAEYSDETAYGESSKHENNVERKSTNGKQDAENSKSE